MRKEALHRWWIRAALGAGFWSVLLLATVAVIDTLGSATDRRVTMTFLILLVVAVGLQTFLGVTGVISLGHVGLMGVGAYTAALLTTSPSIKQGSVPNAPEPLLNAELGFVPATAIGVVVTMVFALLVGLPIVRLSGAAAAVATLGLLVIIHTILSNYESVTRGSKAFYGVPNYANLYWGLGFAAVALLAARLFRDSGIGLGLRSSRNDELAARASGVDVTRSRLIAWTVSAGIVALGGSLYAHFILTLLPSTFFFSLTLVVVTMVIVGGPTISGAVLGAALVSLLTEFLRRAENGFSFGPISVDEAPGLSTIALGLLILLTMILRPKGLTGRWEADEWLGRIVGTRQRQSIEREPEGRSASLDLVAPIPSENRSSARQPVKVPDPQPRPRRSS